MEPSEFIERFLAHEYDPVKAHEYYMRVRKLKGRAGVQTDAKAKAYETSVVDAAQKKLLTDLKGNKVKMNTHRRLGAAEQKLIRSKSLAQRIKDPTVRADMLSTISAAEKKLNTLKQNVGPSKKVITNKPVLKR